MRRRDETCNCLAIVILRPQRTTDTSLLLSLLSDTQRMCNRRPQGDVTIPSGVVTKSPRAHFRAMFSRKKEISVTCHWHRGTRTVWPREQTQYAITPLKSRPSAHRCTMPFDNCALLRTPCSFLHLPFSQLPLEKHPLLCTRLFSSPPSSSSHFLSSPPSQNNHPHRSPTMAIP